MKYEDLITTVAAIVNSSEINKEGLSLAYELPEKIHTQMHEDFFYKTNPSSMLPPKLDVFEVEIGGIIIKFNKRNV